MFVDSHCHLEMESFAKDRDQVIKKSIDEGLKYILTVGTEERYFETVAEIINSHPIVYGAIGIHPHNSVDFNRNAAETIRKYLKQKKIVGYGEIGLDFFKNYSPKERQIKAFREQLALAADEGLPVIIHSRNALAETMQILGEAYRNMRGGVIHCYSYNRETAKRLLDMGFYISIPGTITYRSAEELARVVEYIPGERILAETDAPFLTPHPHRGKRNVPYFVKLTVGKMAEIRHQQAEELAATICENFVRLFLNGREVQTE
ncbi:MAG TPA: TatD family hydrolase [Syntrophorhabdaceae bacterium]|nr:TatD family hydrolase [Syntrophorhabdaceae bacterium]HQM82622.1 TatD family hydrolase [Syntrophorhabdaceae bacterium]